MKKLSDWLKQNPMLKLASLVLAFLIWITVVNFSNPEVTDYVNVELEVRNAEELTAVDQMYSLDTRTVRVSFHVRTRYMNQISPSDFTAYVDLQDYSITGAVPVYVVPDSSISSLISDISSNPMVVHVSTEDMQEKRFDLGVRVNGEPAEGYALGDIELEQDYVYVRGPISEIGTISSAGIEIEAAEAAETFRGSAEVVFYDANGHPIEVDERVELSNDTIDYTQSIYLVKSLSISAGVTGEPTDGYMFDGVETSPSFISVYGPQEILDQYSGIEIPDEAINISGATRNVTLTLDISAYIPEGLTLYEASPQISVIARIRRMPETSAEDVEETEMQTESVSGPGTMTPHQTEESTGELHATEGHTTPSEHGSVLEGHGQQGQQGQDEATLPSDELSDTAQTDEQHPSETLAQEP